MFEKNRNTRSEPASPQSQQDNFKANTSAPVNSGKMAVIGPGIHINGDISGEENLLVEGKVEGKIRLGAHDVEIGQTGKVKADITAKVIKIAGQVRGDLTGTEKVVISRSGNVHGNVVAPRMTLEDGAIFKGSIDMDPGEPAKAAVAKPAKKSVETAVEKPAVKPAAAKATPTDTAPADKAQENNGYSLNGG
jgi:cytoskeletal protein CcmA (bactofilin family)